MRYILALVPPKDQKELYIKEANRLFSTVAKGYLVSENSSPHITLCQFECNEISATKVWKEFSSCNPTLFKP